MKPDPEDVPKPVIKKKISASEFKDIYGRLEANISFLNEKLKEIEADLARLEVKKKSEREEEDYLKKNLAELEAMENEIKLGEEAFRSQLENVVNEEIADERVIKALKKKISVLKKTIEKQLI